MRSAVIRERLSLLSVELGSSICSRERFGVAGDPGVCQVIAITPGVRGAVRPLSCSPFQAAGKRFLLLADEQASGSV